MRTSGFAPEELIGQPHNAVRHPDMPVEAFADMWRSLKAGESWTALVKNRRKNGDHYWVRANAAPMRRHGKLTGDLSVRTRPTRVEIDDATALYRRFKEGRAGEQGRGFAFVVSEVRNLADRSAAAAKEIKVLIDDSANKVDGGTQLVATAGQTMAEVAKQVLQVKNLIAEITEAS